VTREELYALYNEPIQRTETQELRLAVQQLAEAVARLGCADAGGSEGQAMTEDAKREAARFRGRYAANVSEVVYGRTEAQELRFAVLQLVMATQNLAEQVQALVERELSR